MKNKFKYEYGIDENGRRHIILKHKRKFLIFKETSKLFKFLYKNGANEKDFDKAVEHVERVFRKYEKEYVKRILDRDANKKLSYIG